MITDVVCLSLSVLHEDDERLFRSSSSSEEYIQGKEVAIQNRNKKEKELVGSAMVNPTSPTLRFPGINNLREGSLVYGKTKN